MTMEEEMSRKNMKFINRFGQTITFDPFGKTVAGNTGVVLAPSGAGMSFIGQGNHEEPAKTSLCVAVQEALKRK